MLVFAPLGLALAAADATGLAVIGAAVSVALAMVPDYDMRVPLVQHRGVTHTLPFAVFFGIAVGAAVTAFGAYAGVTVEGWVDLYGFGVASLGAFAFLVATLTVLSHLAADALTPMGVPLLWPLSGHCYSLSLARADNLVANYGLLVAGALATLAWARPLLLTGS